MMAITIILFVKKEFVSSVKPRVQVILNILTNVRRGRERKKQMYNSQHHLCVINKIKLTRWPRIMCVEYTTLYNIHAMLGYRNTCTQHTHYTTLFSFYAYAFNTKAMAKKTSFVSDHSQLRFHHMYFWPSAESNAE